jgi:nitrogen fixation protein NifZ
MSNISRDSDTVELTGPPVYDYGDKVRSRYTIRNDGTFPGKDIGDILVTKGEEGYVTSIGTFLQQFYIYGVEFIASGYRVGMKRKELEEVESHDRAAYAEISMGPASAGPHGPV